MEHTKLTWHQIQQQYDHEWVQLIEYEWPEGAPFPVEGVVQFHARTRKEFNALSRQHPTPDAACVFVGKVELPSGTVLSANAMRMRACE